ncbi:hypothetical protein [Acidomonas methanolica]|uniref:hypothetical protein n=1 Tax=Acidomonas methanolica TaxID=437 RepID=UPI001EF9E157|nr:hypothetical protein [Acidomonas methanolica]
MAQIVDFGTETCRAQSRHNRTGAIAGVEIAAFDDRAAAIIFGTSAETLHAWGNSPNSPPTKSLARQRAKALSLRGKKEKAGSMNRPFLK